MKVSSIFIPEFGHLQYIGNIKLLKEKIVAVVGTRHPTCQGLIRAKSISEFITSKGGVTLSGLAEGIDSAVHSSSLSKTIAVLPVPFSRIYPKKNIPLFLKIIENGGLVITPYSNFNTTTKFSFIYRDRIVAFLSSSTIVVESYLPGGSIYTLKWAAEHNRSTFYFDNKKQDLHILKSKYNSIELNDFNFKNILSNEIFL